MFKTKILKAITLLTFLLFTWTRVGFAFLNTKTQNLAAKNNLAALEGLQKLEKKEREIIASQSLNHGVGTRLNLLGLGFLLDAPISEVIKIAQANELEQESKELLSLREELSKFANEFSGRVEGSEPENVPFFELKRIFLSMQEVVNQIYLKISESPKKVLVDKNHKATLLRLLENGAMLMDSRIELIQQKSGFQPQELEKLLKESFSVISNFFGHETFPKTKFIYLNNAASETRVRGNYYSLLKAITNLLENATLWAQKFSKNQAEVILRTKLDNDFVTIQVIDNGPGIDPEKLKRNPKTNRPYVFDLGYSTRKMGTGLGLTEAWYAIQDAGGTIKVDSLTAEEYEKIRIGPGLVAFRNERTQLFIEKTHLEIQEEVGFLLKHYQEAIKLIKSDDVTADAISHLRKSIKAGMKSKIIKKLQEIGFEFSSDEIGYIANLDTLFSILSAELFDVKLALEQGDSIDKTKIIEILNENRRRLGNVGRFISRIAAGKRITPGTTFTIRLPVATVDPLSDEGVRQKLLDVFHDGEMAAFWTKLRNSDETHSMIARNKESEFLQRGERAIHYLEKLDAVEPKGDPALGIVIEELVQHAVAVLSFLNESSTEYNAYSEKLKRAQRQYDAWQEAEMEFRSGIENQRIIVTAA